ncbi:monooxygenase [Mycolicibacterium parafortuitum]|uniref:Monooxygenase n=1 Tax=Mycolicibacterium parafortuitum TaxID=39692 RepID=A0A7I7TVQ0_MYCPF|nr:NAD(P)/FAD-dependent oxidoreductase [Mycolicibacterium parafortuitum]BBY73190.1 monooxygenase [Mycolicibacterium parafortuitum]
MQSGTGSSSRLSLLSDAELTELLQSANIPTLLAAMAHLTGEDRWIQAPYTPTPRRDIDDHDDGGLSADLVQEIRENAFTVLRELRDGERTVAATPSPERLVQILSVSVGEPLPADYGQLLGEELGIYPRSGVPEAPAEVRGAFHVAIIGAGLSGLCLAIRLEQAGIGYTVFEKNDDVGGSWEENLYPGCGVDTPSHLYCYSFDQNPDWTRYFVHRDELAAYWRALADRWGVRPRIRFGTTVESARFNEETARWEVRVTGREGSVDVVEANAVVSAVGLLNQPAMPRIAGLEDFEGPSLHTARWDRSIDLTGQRVAVIGTGASAMQFVPAAAEIAGSVTVFQRSPQWAMPHPNQSREVSEAVRALHRHIPHYLGWYRLRVFWRMGDRLHSLLQVDNDYEHPDRAINKGNDALRKMLTGYIHAQLDGRPDLIEKSVPSYPVYGKRLLIDHGWYTAIRRDNVALVTDPIDQITPAGIRMADGTEHDFDVIAFATGFDAVNVLGSIDVFGRGGRSLHAQWGSDDGRAYLGITVPGFPNFFCLYGPNTNTGHGGTVIAGSEMQVQYVTNLIAQMIDEDVASVEVRQDVFDSYDDELGQVLANSIWTHPGMSTYYRNSKGRVVTNSPWKYIDYWRRTHQPNMEDFTVARSAAGLQPQA